MQLDLSPSIGGRHTEYPAAVVNGLTILAPSGLAHNRRWEGLIDTGADMTIVPVEVIAELRLTDIRQRVQVWSYRKDDPPREFSVYYLKLRFPSGLAVPTKAIASERRNILIGRSALLSTSLTINWPANRWSLEEVSLPTAPP